MQKTVKAEIGALNILEMKPTFQNWENLPFDVVERVRGKEIWDMDREKLLCLIGRRALYRWLNSSKMIHNH